MVHTINFTSECTPQLSITERQSGHYASLSTMLNQLHSVNSMRSTSAINLVTTENMIPATNVIFSTGMALYANNKLTPSTVSKNKWNIKKDKGESTICALYILCVMNLEPVFFAKLQSVSPSHLTSYMCHCFIILINAHKKLCDTANMYVILQNLLHSPCLRVINIIIKQFNNVLIYNK